MPRRPDAIPLVQGGNVEASRAAVFATLPSSAACRGSRRRPPLRCSRAALPRACARFEKVTSHAQFVAKPVGWPTRSRQEQPFTIQVANERFIVPADAEMSIEHERREVSDALELQLRWRER